MMGHISDRTLDNLLEGSIDDAGELAIEEHVRRCDRCAHRLREWEMLFPQIKNLIPTGEHPAMSAQGAIAAPRPHAVFIPDWTPPRSAHTLPTRLAWGVVIALAAGAGYLLFQRTKEESPSIGYLPESYEMATESSESSTGDSAGLGSGIPTTPEVQLPSLEAARAQQESALARARDSVALASAKRDSVALASAKLEREPAQRETPPPQPEARQSVEQDVRVPSPNRETPVSFPIKAATPPTQQANRNTTPAEPARDPAALAPLPNQFQRVTLGEAISRLSGSVRLIQGLNPEAVEIAQGSALPGADPGKAVVRVVYNAPEGRLIMDQQRLDRPGSREPNIAISTAPNGVSVAQWVDRGGFWISLAGRADQQTLLAIANRIR
jgi:hypothetical protein